MTAVGWRRALPRVLGVAILLLGALWWVTRPGGTTATARFTSAVGIYRGTEVRVLGVPVGAVDSVTPRGTYVDVALHLDAGVRVSARSVAVIVSPNLVSDRFIQLTDTAAGGPALRSGATIPLSRTRTSVELDELYRGLSDLSTALGPRGANAGGALSRLLEVAAANLHGNGAALNTTLRSLSKVSGALGDAHGDIGTTLDALASFTRMLARNDGALHTVNDQLAAVARTFAVDRRSLGSALHELGVALWQVQAFVRDNRAALAADIGSLSRAAQALGRRQQSLVTALRAAPQLVQNFLAAYDPTHNVLRGRADLNELTVWGQDAQGSTAGPPTLLPAANVGTTGGGR